MKTVNARKITLFGARTRPCLWNKIAPNSMGSPVSSIPFKANTPVQKPRNVLLHVRGKSVAQTDVGIFAASVPTAGTASLGPVNPTKGPIAVLLLSLVNARGKSFGFVPMGNSTKRTAPSLTRPAVSFRERVFLAVSDSLRLFSNLVGLGMLAIVHCAE